MRMVAKISLTVLAAGSALWFVSSGRGVHADDDERSLLGAWQITISSPPSCQGAPPACTTASEFTNFYPGGTLTETNTILFAAGEPNPPSFSSASDGYGVWGKTEDPKVFSVKFEKFLFQTVTVPTFVSPSGKLVMNTGVAIIEGRYTVNSDRALSGTFTIKTVPNNNTPPFEASGSVKGMRLDN
jgi:hypothetical protein